MTLLQETLEIKVHYFTKKGPTQCHQISWGHQEYNEIKGLLRTQTIFHGNGHGCWKETYHMTLSEAATSPKSASVLYDRL